MAKQDNMVFHFAGRWSLPIVDRGNEEKVEAFCHEENRLEEKLREDGFDKFIYQLEKTGQDNYHWQIYCHKKEKTRPSTLGKSWNEEFFGIEFKHASTNGINSLKKYCMKTDTRVRGPFADHVVYMGEDLPEKLFPWQEDLLYKITEPPDDRSLLWIYDVQGNCGKSKFAKFMCYHHQALCLCYGNSGDLLNLVCKFPNRSVYLFDLTRTKPATFSDQDIYATMEQIKNGYIINTKYETDVVMMKPPHVVIFANVKPKMSCCSPDRWKVHQLSMDGFEPPLFMPETPSRKRPREERLAEIEEMAPVYISEQNVEDLI